MTYQEFIEFNRNKDQGQYTQKHHIIPLSAGGTDDESNLIRLSWLTHYYAHFLLAKENPDDKEIQHYWKIKGDLDRWLHWCYSCATSRCVSEETKAILREKCSGWHHTEETKKIISERSKGHPVYEYQKEKLRELNRERLLGTTHDSWNKGKKWFNNGIKSIMAYECPIGFIPGRISRKG